MLIPIGTNRPLRHTPYITHALILLNILASIGALIAFGAGPESLEAVVRRFGLTWTPAEPWRFLSYAFIHAGWGHLVGNLLLLWVFGPSVEDRFGKIGYLLFYLAGAAVAGLAHVAVETSPVVGASGGVAAVTGAYLVLFPRTLIRTLVLFVIIGIWNIPALWFIAFAIARDFLLTDTFFGSDNVAHTAHLGGYGLGISVALFLLATHILPREDFDLFYMFRQSKRRKNLREAVQQSQQRISTAPATNRARPALTKTPKPVPAEPSLPDEALRIRAHIAARIKEEDMAGAAAAYTQLADTYADTPGAASLTKRHQLLIANHFFQNGDHTRAAAAYERFLATHASDPEAANVRLMLGLVLGRYLNNPDRARDLITEASAKLHEPDDRAFAQELLTEFGGTPATSSTVPTS